MDQHEIERVVLSVATRATLRIHDEAMQRLSSKAQITKSDIIKAFDLATFKDLTGRLGLKPIRQNGPTGKLYYNTKKVLETLSKWYH